MPNGFLGRAFVAMWRLNGMDRNLQMITTSDIGKVAAEAFLNAEKEEYKNKAISLAGDELTPNEAAKVFQGMFLCDMPRMILTSASQRSLGSKYLRRTPGLAG